MDNTPNTAPAEAPKAPESVETPTNTNPEPAKAPEVPDMHGFTSEQLADMKKFFDNNGGFDGVKAKISNPAKPAEPAAKPAEAPAPQPQPQAQEEASKPIPGAVTQSDFFAKQYFKDLAGEEKYEAISKSVAGGEYLKTMDSLGIQWRNQDGSINDAKVRDFLDIMAQTVPAKPTAAEPDASAAPTVSYVNVGDKIENIDQAYQVIMQPNHPKSKEAEEFIKNHLNPNSGKQS